jgi:hypothetical protein
MSQLQQHEFEVEELMAYLDGELEPQRAAALVAHLYLCAECQALVTEFRQISDRMLDFEIEPMPESVAATVRTAAEDWNPQVPKTSRAWENLLSRWRFFAHPQGWALMGAAAIAAIVCVLVIANWPPTTGRFAPAAETSYSSVAQSQGGLQQQSVDSFRVPEGVSTLVPPPAPATPQPQLGPVQPMITRTASLSIVPSNYDQASAAIEGFAASHGGYVQALNAQSQTASSRSLSATLRVPAQQLEATLAELRRLGHVEQESQDNSDVTEQYVDLDARLKNARATEQRLTDLLAARTGKLEDVLDVERELARVRGDVESMDAQRTALLHRVDYATVHLELLEQYQAQLGSQAFGVRVKIWNSAVAGLGYLVAGSIGALVFILTYGPSIAFWFLLILAPTWLLWRKYGVSRHQ